MKILIVVPRLNIGGAESYVYTLALGLIRRNIEVVLASGGGYLADVLVKQNIRHYYCPIRLSQKLTAYRLKQIILREKIDLVHANSAGAAYPVGDACLAAKIPWVMTAHGFFREKEAMRGIDRATKVICVSRFLRDYVIAHTSMRPQQFTVIYNGIDLNAFQPAGAQPALRAHWNLKQDDFVVGIVARMARLNGKGHLDLLEAMAREPREANWKLLIVGKGKFAWRLKLIALFKGLRHRVVFAGRQTNVPATIGCCDVLALPSQIETFGLVLAEGMAMGKPVLAYAVGGTPEAVRHEKTGYLVKPHHIDDLIRHIQQLQQNPVLRESLGQCGIEHVRQNFNVENMVENTIKLYQEILSGG